MIPLPIDSAIPEIIARVRESRAVVLVAPPGAGKTTRVGPALLAAGLLSPSHPQLLMLQPRRVAARAAATRIAEEQGWGVGREVGYQIRFENRVGPQTRLRVLTEGILTRRLVDDPFLEGVGAVLLDEFHERSLHTDLCAALLREVRQTVREDLIIVIMSATLEAEPVAAFFGGCPMVRSLGRAYPVEIRHAGWSQERIAERAARAVAEVVASPSSDDAGDVLVFLPGAEEIRRTVGALGDLAARENLLLLPLHGGMPFEEQVRALRPAPPGKRKILCATNIAETSLTIDGVRTVIDSGYARVASYDPARGLDRLDLERISRASATQRAGRAGRQAPGQCVRLWSAAEERAMAEFQSPEAARVDLAGTVLLLHAWGKPDPRAFGWYERPPEAALAAAERLLVMLGALTEEHKGRITPLGRAIADLPVHPRLARLLLAAADAGRFEEGAALAALLSEKDIARSDRDLPPGARHATMQGASDLLLRLDSLERAEAARFAPHLYDAGIDPTAARQVAKVRDDLLRVGRRLIATPKHAPAIESDSEETLLKLALLAYPDRVCKRRISDPAAGVMVGGGGVRLAAESVVRQPAFFLALDARADERAASREALVRIASGIEEQWLDALFPQQVRRERAVEFDVDRQRVVGLRRTWYRDLLLREAPDAAVDPTQAGAALFAALRSRASELFAADEAAALLLARVDLLRRHAPEHPWPTLDDEELQAALADACREKRAVEELNQGALSAALRDRLPYPLDRLLDQLAPESIQVPTGNRIALQYIVGQAPVLAVRLQEVFGWTDTPRVAGGRVAVLLHLLGPNYRPVQVTNDLKSFWATTYFQVRKDLRVRYPKHAWPEDPLNAAPEARGGRRRK